MTIRYGLGAGFPKVAGKCPMGCGTTLFLGAGGHVTCSWIDCPNPCAADEMLCVQGVQARSPRLVRRVRWYTEPAR